MNSVSVLGSAPVAGLWDFLTRDRLRVLAYHTVPNPEAFAAHLDHIADNYTPVTGRMVADSMNGGKKLPKGALWITFDDGDVSVVRNALPLLSAHRMPATAFVCGGWVGTSEVPWWQLFDAAFEAGVIQLDDLGSMDRGHLLHTIKTTTDEHRRSVMATWSQRLDASGTPATSEQWSVADLRAWINAGNEVGNHSWDHPCLDRCDADEQVRQITMAHARLTELLGAPPDLFAWPNGNTASAALDTVRQLEYRLVLGFDHRVCARRIDPWAISRVRIDSDVPVKRAWAIMSGAHSSVFHLSSRLRRGGSDDSDT